MLQIQIKAQKIKHKNEFRIRLDFKKNAVFIKKIKSIKDRRWSRTMAAWHVPYDSTTWKTLQEFFPDIMIVDSQFIEHTPSPLPIAKSTFENKTPKANYPEPSKNQVILIPDQIAQPIKKWENTIHGPLQKIVGDQLVVHQWDDFWLSAYVPFKKLEWLDTIKRIPGRQWNVEGKCWFLPFNKETLHELKDYFKEKLVLHAVEHADLPDKWYYFPKKQTGFDKLNNTQRQALTALEERLMLECKSWRTIKSYKNHLIALMLHYPDAKPSTLKVKQIEHFIVYKKREVGIAISTHNSYISAFNAFYGRVCGQEEKVLKLVRPKKKKKLPNILSKEEVKIFLRSISNIKHKAMFILIYSAGLRRGELLNLRVRDLNKSRACIFIRDAKGGKDRYVMFSKTAQRFVENYMKVHKPRYWLFEGQVRDKYSATSLQDAFEVAKESSGINPTITIHGLRHSFATHMVDNNVPLHAVQQMLGHTSIKTTEIYLHLSEKYLKSIESPLENLDL